MTNAVVGAIEALCIDAVELAHAFGEVSVRRLHEQMVVIARQAEGVHGPVEPFPHTGEDIEKHSPVGVR